LVIIKDKTKDKKTPSKPRSNVNKKIKTKGTLIKSKIKLPYCMKLLIQELQTMSLAPRLITDTNIDNVPVFKFLYENMSQYSVENDFLDDDDIEEDVE